jgi:hypothetical protein
MLKDVWMKPDFPFNPHITIYDGASPEFARRLFDLLKSYSYRLRFRADELEAMASRKGQRSLQLALAFNSSYVRKIVGKKITADEVPILTDERRLEFVAELCKHLALSPHPRSGAPSVQSALPFPKRTNSLPS